MNWNIQEVEVGIAIGGVAGAAIGYELRKLVVRFQTWRKARRKREKYTEAKIIRVLKPGEGVMPPVIPIGRARRNTPANRGSEIHGWPENPDRDDVIAALMGSGYSKTEAVKAADACSLVERAHGVEAWMRAAFTNATRKS